MSRWFRGFAVLVLMLPGSGCGPKADLAQPKQYSHALVSFSYPGNWKLTSDAEQKFGRMLILEGPDSSIVTLSVFTADWDADLHEFANLYVEGLPQSIPIGRIADGTLTDVASPRTSEEAVDYRFAIVLVGTKVPHTANLWKQVHGDTKVIGVTQVSDEDRPGIDEGFQFIRDTLSAPRPE